MAVVSAVGRVREALGVYATPPVGQSVHDPDAAFEGLAAFTAIEQALTEAREALDTGLADLLRYAPAHWRNQSSGEFLMRRALALLAGLDGEGEGAA